MMAGPAEYYTEKIGCGLVRLSKLRRLDRLYATLKLVLFFSAAFFFADRFPARLRSRFLLLALALGAFLVLSVCHERVLRDIRRLRKLRGLHQAELVALEKLFPEPQDAAGPVGDDQHPYAGDLDLFGPRSLYQLIDRSVTGMGRRELMRRLLQPSAADEIGAMQEAVHELAADPDFRFRLRLLEPENGEDEDAQEKLESFWRLPALLDGRRLRIILIHLLPLATIATPVFAPFRFVLLPLAIQIVFNARTAKKRSAAYREAVRHFQTVGVYSRLLREIEGRPATAAKLLSLQKTMTASGPMGASSAIRRLAILLEWAEVRSSGIMHIFLNNLLLWDLHCLWRIEKWRARHAEKCRSWLTALGEIDYLSSLANLSFNHPDWIFPRLSTDGPLFCASGIGHPLIPAAEIVGNDFDLRGCGRVAVITGPNMAGKSTFLRSVGLAIVMAQAGAPVCASAMSFSPLRLVCSMKTTDSLDRHMSLFYAELLRLKMILDAIGDGRGEGRDVFFMIDEMLKGTNAADRHQGAQALVRQLLRLPALGIVATHDLEITMMQEGEAGLANYHFDGQIRDDRLLFDYRLQPGPCRSANALALMRKIGIAV